jgi:hypothetical protein
MSEPLVPVTVIEEVAAGVAVVVVTVSVEAPDDITEKLDEAPLGNPLAASVTAAANPLVGVMVTK